MIVVQSKFLNEIAPSGDEDICKALNKYLSKINIKSNYIVDVLVFYKVDIDTKNKEGHNEQIKEK